MIAFALATLLLSRARPPVDTAAVYAAVVREVRAGHPTLQVALATSVREAFEPSPSAPREHSPAVLRKLRSSGLVDATCTVPPNYVSCSGQETRMSLALGGIRVQERAVAEVPAGAVWVMASVILPCAGECRTPTASGVLYLLTQGRDGWRVVSSRVIWTW
jgi:hypothetical protein